MTVETETVEVPTQQSALLAASTAAGAGGHHHHHHHHKTLKSKQSTETIRPKREKRRVARKLPAVNPMSGECG
jgi:hypothetical protein